MNKLDGIFRDGSKALIGYVTVGYPDIETTLRLVPLMAESGCDAIELGIPFSDPIGDGPTIQRAAAKALENSVTVETCLKAAGTLSRTTRVPLLFMGYFNPVLRRGIDSFCAQAGAAGISGLIIPDLPPEESGQVRRACSANGMHLVYLVAPTTTGRRLGLVAKYASGFIYVVSVTGVTGARTNMDSGLPEFIRRVRQSTDVPLCVGFGVSTPAQARAVSKIVDGVIVGSRIIELVEKDPTLAEVAGFIKSMKQALSGSPTR